MKRLFAAMLLLVLLLVCTPKLAADANTDLLILYEDLVEPLVINKDTTMDLNGHTVRGEITVVDGYTLMVMDSQTDDYTINDDSGYGKLLNTSGKVVAADGYLQVNENDGMSFHKVTLSLISVTLRPENAGIYYGGDFYGDELVAERVDRFGIALRLNMAPVTGTLLNDVMKKGISAEENKARAQYKIYGSAYIRTTDGQYIFSESQNYSFMKVMQLADDQWPTLTKTQKKAIESLYNRFESIIGTWSLPNINEELNGDIDIPI